MLEKTTSRAFVYLLRTQMSWSSISPLPIHLAFVLFRPQRIFTNFLSSIRSELSNLPSPQPRLVVKIAPDLNVGEIRDIAKAVVQNRIDGVIVSNTTTQRPGSLTSPYDKVYEQGGLSGPPLKPLSLRALKLLNSQLKQLPGGKDVVLIGCGGINSGKDAIEYARAGATIVQCYTGFVYDGVGFARRIKDEIVEQLGNRRWSDIVGIDS